MPEFGFQTEGIELVRRFEDQVQGRTFLITGPSQGGIGAETAISLAHGNPAVLILVARSREKVQPVIDAIKAIHSSINVKFVSADLTSLASVRSAADVIMQDPEITKIDAVINNAGIMASPFTLTADGMESQLESNHLGHFVLTNRLMPKILAGDRGARVVAVSSTVNKYAGIRWDDPNFKEPGSYSPWAGYGQSKTANILFAVALNQKLRSRGLAAYSLHPGSVGTGLQVHLTAELAEDATMRMYGKTLDEVRKEQSSQPKTLQQGCATSLRAALDPDLPKQPGVWLMDCQISTDPYHVADWALDPKDAERCWTWSEELVGEKFSY